MISLRQVELVDFGDQARTPTISLAEYEQRLETTLERMKEHGLQFLLVYADREHSTNMSYLIGFDPRFEEAVLLLDAKGNQLLLVGNECMGYLPDPALECQVELFQEFSLPGQARDDSAPLRSIVSDFGVGKGVTVGCVGWKYFTGQNVENPATTIEIPSYIVDLLRDLVQDPRAVTNAAHIFIDPDTGLRTINSADQIACFEYAAIKTSKSILAALTNIRKGVTEKELERHFWGGGLPRSCHPMISFGEKVRRGLSSPSDNVARIGDAFVLAFGVKGALNCRAGAVARGPEDVPEQVRDFYARLAANYFEVVVSWYESVKVGAGAGDVFATVDARRQKELFFFAVNPGHYIHLDEWVHSPFVKDSSTVLKSGMALQMDIIPVSQGPFCYINAEDGIALADGALRQEIAARHPDCWRRIAARQRFMREILGITIDDSVLPLSNTPAWLAPYALSPGLAFVRR